MKLRNICHLEIYQGFRSQPADANDRFDLATPHVTLASNDEKPCEGVCVVSAKEAAVSSQKLQCLSGSQWERSGRNCLWRIPGPGVGVPPGYHSLANIGPGGQGHSSPATKGYNSR